MLDSSMLHSMNGLDLNHARALHFLLEEANVARAARKLGITPAAASNALRRLRADFGDQLLVRSGRTLARTPRADDLRAPAKAVMVAAERLFERGRPFDPGGEAWEITLRRRIESPSCSCPPWTVCYKRGHRERGSP